MKLSTFFIIAGMVIISLYFMVEVSFYATTAGINENRSDTPYLEIPAIGVDQSINNKSIDYGIYYESQSARPGFGTVVLAGHRTFYSSPFLKLDQLKSGDNITVSWPEIGNVEYTVVNSFVVPASYQLPLDQGKTLILYTCYPLGSSKERLIIQANQTKITPFSYVKTNNESNGNNNSPIPYALLLIGSFLGIGLVLSYAYPVNEDKKFIFITTVALTLFLFYEYLFPTPTDYMASIISNISSWFGD